MTRNRLKTVISSCLAIALAWYDFFLFGFLAVVIGRLFFPSETEAASLVKTFLVFGVSFLFRPLGSLFFANIGDKLGRKRALLLSVSLITLPTVLIGLLPTYAQAGALATFLLVALRAAQGFTIGGERSASISFLTEHAPPNMKGLFGSLALMSTTLGILLASGVNTIMTTTLTEEQVLSWGWRVPFLLGALTGLIAYFLRRSTEETEEFEGLKMSGGTSKTPIPEALRKHWRAVLTALAATMVLAVGFYTIFLYMISFAATVGKMSLSMALKINTLSMLALTIFIPVFGHLSDRIGRKKVLSAGCLGLLVVSAFIFEVFAGGSLFWKASIQLMASLSLAMVAGPIPAFFSESFPTKVRVSGISLGHVLSFSLFGGSAPLVAAYLTDSTGSTTAPGIYLMACTFISLITFLLARETRWRPVEVDEAAADRLDYSVLYSPETSANRLLRETIWGEDDIGQESFINPAFLDELSFLMNLKEESRVLDIGCGLGGPAVYLATRTGCRVLGIDTSNKGVKIANNFAKSAGLGYRVKFEVCDALQMPYKDGAFDHALGINIMNIISDKESLLHSAGRVLKSGGLFAILTGTVDLPEDTAVRESMSRGFYAPMYYDTPESYRLKLLNTGFGIIQVIEYVDDFLIQCRRWRDAYKKHYYTIVDEQGRENTDNHIIFFENYVKLIEDDRAGLYLFIAVKK